MVFDYGSKGNHCPKIFLAEFGTFTNETAAFLWKEAVGKEEISEEELTATLLEAYEVDEETARKDVAQVLAKWREIGLLA